MLAAAQGVSFSAFPHTIEWGCESAESEISGQGH